MTFVTLPPAKTSVAPRTAAGARGVRFPATGLTEVPVLMPGTVGTGTEPPVVDYAVEIPHGEHRHERVPADNRLSAREHHMMFGALHLTWQAVNGVILLSRWNAGTGPNNISQFLTYEIVGTSGRRMQLRGRHPGRVVFGNAIDNPEWPGIDPETMEPLPKWITVPEFGSLPAGAQVIFAPESSLADGGPMPMITKVEAPTSAGDLDDCTFWVVCSCDVGQARQPLDLKYPPGDGKYWCSVYWYFTAPEPLPNYQETIETQWTRRTVDYAPEDLDGEDRLELLDSAGGSCRVLWPGMPWPEELLRVELRTASGSTLLDATGRLATVDTGTGWETRLSLAGHTAGLVSVRVTYWPEAVAGDTARWPYYGACVNSQVDWTGGYVHAGGRLCRNVECSKFAAGGFRAHCWDPTASGFGIGNGEVSWGSITFGATSPADGGWVSRWWEDNAVTIVQVMESTDAYFLERTGGPSLGELCGGFALRVPRGKFTYRDSWHGPAFGQLVSAEDEGGNVSLSLKYGLFAAAEAQDLASRTPTAGLMPTLVDGWTGREGDDGEALQDDLAVYPVGHIGRCHLYNLTHGGSALASRCRKSPVVEDRHSGGLRVASAQVPGVGNIIRGRLE
jgi:hypothetical protein